MTPRSEPRPSNRIALASLILANLVPLVGVFLWDWNLSDLLLLYWIENGVIGIYTVLKMLTSSVPGLGKLTNIYRKLQGVPFFIVSYGIFWLIHGLFVVVLFNRGGPTIPVQPDTFFFAAVIVSWMRADVLAWPVIGLLLSHGVSFVSNFLLGGEYRRQSIEVLMNQPYERVLILHLTIVFGGFIVMLLGSPQLVLVLFVVLKVVIDVQTHLREHAKANRSLSTPS
ncbi:MAG: hypothetical protein KF813_14405 [Trueperaceae bacterium]|nr:hypothetical protein [Trueperaceae bacterium]